MSAQIETLSSYILEKENIRQKLLDEIEELNEKIRQRDVDTQKKYGEMHQNIITVIAITAQYSKSTAEVTEEDKLKREAQLKRFFNTIETQSKLIERYTLDILTFNENKSKAQIELAEVEAEVNRLKGVERYVSTPIDAGDVDITGLLEKRISLNR